MFKSINKISVQTWAYLFIILFFLLVGMNYAPFLFQEDGRMIGGFNLGDEGNLLHVLSGMWAATALWYSRNSIIYYFRIFGTVYFFDGVVGMIAGKAFLNLNLFHSHAAPHGEFLVRLILNTPHLTIGGLAMVIGFILFKIKR
jgi:hypothetical protein